MKLKKNVGTFDQWIRIVIGIIFIILYQSNTVKGAFGIVLLVLAGILFITALVNFCPLYILLGINTCKKTRAKKH
jgi:hypothetical protein